MSRVVASAATASVAPQVALRHLLSNCISPAHKRVQRAIQNTSTDRTALGAIPRELQILPSRSHPSQCPFTVTSVRRICPILLRGSMNGSISSASLTLHAAEDITRAYILQLEGLALQLQYAKQLSVRSYDDGGQLIATAPHHGEIKPPSGRDRPPAMEWPPVISGRQMRFWIICL